MRGIFTLLCSCVFFMCKGQLLTWTPDFIQENTTNVTVTADATKGNQGLLNYTPVTDVYVHVGVITNYSTSSSDWKHVPFSWGTTTAAANAVSAGTNKWKFTFAGSLRSFFNITDANEHILKIAIIFRSGNGNAKLVNADGADMFMPVYNAGELNVRIDNPARQPKYTPVQENYTYNAGDAVNILAKSSLAADLKVLYNGNQVAATTTAATSITTSASAVSGDNQIVVAATASSVTKYDTIKFFINTPVVTAALPSGVKDGINYNSGTSVTLVLYAPDKTRAAVIGDFNNWTQTSAYQMFRTPDGQRYWITLTNLNPGQEYAYQYLVDGSIKVADIYAEKVLDPWNDQYIPSANYPSLKAYPAGQAGIVGIFQTNKPAFSWQYSNYTKPDKRNLIIYELLVRDFVAAQNWQTLKDTLPYLKRLGINAIELMPFNEFEGNNSWGYNPDFYFAPDKMYGTETALKQFIDECHHQGIAVLMDIAMNHAFGLSPTVQLYWDAANNRPAANSPYHNPIPKHPFNVGYDFNHESDATKYLVTRVVQHWLLNYKIDGFRWDLSKGFTQTDYGTSDANVTAWGQYDAGRVAIWKRIYDSMQVAVPGSYCILEHFADNSEELVLSNYGMLLWGNLNYNYNEATMGWISTSNFQYGIYTNRGWTQPNLVTYQESHDEERLMFKNEQYGNSNSSYNVKDLATALKRNQMATAFWAMQPAPKMLWQFGELGYDYSINRCEDGSINNSCRTNPKPIVWNYAADANRAALYSVYQRLFALRNYAGYLPAWTSNNISYNLSGAFKTLQVNAAALNITVIGNFDIVPATSTVTFQHAGTWYDYLLNTTRTATGGSETITLQPGEYHVFLDQNASAALPLNLLSFTGRRTNSAIALQWTTSNEVNVRQFELQRSLNGTDFVNISTQPAGNTGAVSNYIYEDRAVAATNANGVVYYRLRSVDKDGSTAYSNIVSIQPLSGSVRVYPNPVSNGLLYVQPANAAVTTQVTLVDASGRICYTRTITGTATATLYIGNLANGLYTLKTDNGGQVVNQKLLIRK
jgi:1,4-alpha-glucan branching enzyme